MVVLHSGRNLVGLALILYIERSLSHGTISYGFRAPKVELMGFYFLNLSYVFVISWLYYTPGGMLSVWH